MKRTYTRIDRRRIPLESPDAGPRHFIEIILSFGDVAGNAARGYDVTAYHITHDRGLVTWSSDDLPRRLAFIPAGRQSKAKEAHARAALAALTTADIMKQFPEWKEDTRS